MKEDDKYYVYIHIKLNGEIFYVGKGSGNRAYSKHRRSKFWNDILKKYEYDVFILEKRLTENEAFDLEKEYIRRIGRRDLGTGTLVNLTDGGEGGSGRISKYKGVPRSKEVRDKISKSVSICNIGGLNSSAKKVIDINTNIIYDCIKDVALIYSKHPRTITKYLNSDKNKTNLRWYAV